MTPQEYVFKTEPFQHQRDVFEESADKEYWAYFLEPGLGKSKLLIDNIAYLYMKGEIEGAVVSTVKAMTPTFSLVEFPTHTPDDVNYLSFRYDAAKVNLKSFKTEWVEFLKFKGLKVFIINTEGAMSPNLTRMMREFYAVVGNRYLMGIDESSQIKTHTAKRSKAIVKFSRAAKYRRIMTGTPVTNGPLEIFGQAMALGPTLELLGHKSFYSFRGYFADMEKKTFGNRSFNVVTGYKNTKELTDTMGSWSSIIRKEDALDLPDKIYSKVVVEMTKKQKAMYEKLRQEAIIELESIGDEIEVTNILTMVVKLHQIVCGQLKYQDDFGAEKYETIENNRIQTLMDLLELEEGNVIIWAHFRQSLYDIIHAVQEKYGVESVIPYYGSVSQKSREEAVSRFQDQNDPARFFIGNPQSAGMGLTLTAADLAIYYSNSYSLEQRIQSEDRHHRIGQTRVARYIDLVTPDTIDEKVLSALRSKKSLADRIVVSNWRNIL